MAGELVRHRHGRARVDDADQRFDECLELKELVAGVQHSPDKEIA